MKQIFLTLIAVALSASAMQGQGTFETTQAKANRFFEHQEWASAAAMYNFMLQEKPNDSDIYGRAIVSTEMLGDTLRSQELLTDAMKYGVPLDSILNKVRRYSFMQSKGDMYEQFMLSAIQHNPWLQRPIDSYLLRYYVFRRDGKQMIAYANKMLSGTPGNVPFMQDLAEGYMIDGQPLEAVNTWQQILVIDPKNYLAILNLANYYDINHQNNQALTYFRKAQEIKSTPYVDAAIRRLSHPTT